MHRNAADAAVRWNGCWRRYKMVTVHNGSASPRHRQRSTRGQHRAVGLCHRFDGRKLDRRQARKAVTYRGILCVYIGSDRASVSRTGGPEEAQLHTAHSVPR